MHIRVAPALVALCILSACAQRSSQGLRLLRVSATSAAAPWLGSAYDCAPTGSAVMLASPNQADVILRLTEPRPLLGPAYQVGTDDLLVVTHTQVAVGQLSPKQVQALFAGQVRNWRDVGGADLEVQVWVYARTADVQEYFERAVLDDRPVSSLARLAVSAQDMSDSVGASPGSIGLLPRHWKTGNTREVLSIPSLPVLALTDSTPTDALAELIACMQTKQ